MIMQETSRGISHIEDLPFPEFIQVLTRLHEYNITEKVDGSQILFGIDEIGFYTSRESKGGPRIYNESDYEMQFRTTYIRSAHKLLEKVLPSLKEAGLKVGCQIEAEVLYGKLPNVVPYSDNVNYLIFLRTTEGTVNINSIKTKFNDRLHSVSLIIPFTNDGKFIYLKEEVNNWQFSEVPKVRVNSIVIQDKLRENLNSMIEYLNKSSGVDTLLNIDVSRSSLNKRPEWCELNNWRSIKQQIKEKRTEINGIVNKKYVSVIKNILLENFVHSQQSKFGPSLAAGGWIEGVVLRHPHTGKMVKIVDKNKFGVIRETAWKTRNALTERARSVNEDCSFLGNLFVAMANSIGHPDLGTMQAKNYLRKIGTINEERLNSLSVGVDILSVKEHWLLLLEEQCIQLEQKLDIYKNEKIMIFNEQHLIYDNCQISTTYDYIIDKRNKEVFASLFEQINVISKNVSEAVTVQELFEVLIGKQLKDLQ